MFTTFVGTSPSPIGYDQRETPAAIRAERPKRNQVARACDFCRLHRIKCSDSYPCHNCRDEGIECHKKGTNEVRALPHASK